MSAESTENINYRTLTAAFANDMVYRRGFGQIRYVNKELLAADIALDLNQFIIDEGSRMVYRYLQTFSENDRNDYIKQAVKPLQRSIGDKLCNLYNIYHGQDDGLFDMTATANYKAIQGDLVEFMIHFINLAAQGAAEAH